MQIHHYFSMSKWNVYPRLIHKLDLPHVNIVLDLEDSVQDPFDIQRTIRLKENAREGLTHLVQHSSFHRLKSRHLIRINSVASPYFEKDMDVICHLVKQNLIFPRIILPKTESMEEIDRVFDRFKECKELEIVPMIETESAYNRMPSFVASMAPYAQRGIIQFVYWGYFDYMLDCSLFPFHRIDDTEYWHALSSFNERLNQRHIHLASPAFCSFDEGELLAIKSTLLQHCGDSIAICSLGLQQTTVFSRPLTSLSPLTLKTYHDGMDEKKHLAKEVMDGYELSRRKPSDRSFAITSGGRFISPQEYQAAKEFLEVNS